MRLKRFMKGSVRPRKHGRHKVWVAQWWEGEHRKSKALGKCSEISKSQADAAMAAILQPLNDGAGRKQIPVYTFKQYVEDVFLPVCRRKWKESTRMTSEATISFHLVPALGTKLISAISRDDMQAFLDRKAETHSQSIVAHLRWHLSAIFKMALGDGLVGLNPTIGLYTPACKKPAQEKRVLSKDQIRTALDALGLRERLIFRMAVFDGMRPGEILAIRIGNVRENAVHVDQRIYRGKLDSPKGRKGKRTARTVALSPGSAADLKLWQEVLPETEPTAFLFPSEQGTALSRDNLWRRTIQPKLQKIGLEWATFQVLRRTNASLSRKAKIDDKVAADQRGHGLGVSLEVYAVSDLQQKIEAVTRLESEVIQP